MSLKYTSLSLYLGDSNKRRYGNSIYLEQGSSQDLEKGGLSRIKVARENFYG